MRCIEAHTGNCAGEVSHRESLSGTGTPIVRCDYHWQERLTKQDEFNRRDADARRVDWFDAGEVYEESY